MANTDWTRLLDGNSLLAIQEFISENLVSYTTTQSLTDSQKKKARENIGANIEIIDLTVL